MSTIFTKIIQGEIPCHKLKEDDRFLAFLDVRPIRRGHTLVIPKIETDYIFDLEEDLLSGILPFAKSVADAIREVEPCIKVGIAVVGIEVPHAHVHLVPIDGVRDIDFSRAQQVEQEILAEVAEEIRSVLK